MFKIKPSNEKGMSLPKIHVVICTLKTGNLPVEIAEFDAIQDKDQDFNMFIEHLPLKFKEELNRNKHYIIDHLYYKLNISEKTKIEKIKEIDKKITQLENSITQTQLSKGKTKDLKDIKTENNINDLDNDLRHFKILRYTVENEGAGSYEIINKNGEREVRFLARDGVFHPYFYRSDVDKGSVLTLFPDLALSRKYFREVDDKITDRFLKNQDSNFFSGIKGVLITIAIVLLVVANIMWASNNMKDVKEIDDRVAEYRNKCETGATDCAYYYAKLIQFELINKNVSDIIEDKPDLPTTSPLVDISKSLTGQT